MANINPVERETQDRLIRHLTSNLGYTYVGNRHHEPDNQNMDFERLQAWLAGQRQTPYAIAEVVRQLEKARHIPSGSNLYETNRQLYELLRYGVEAAPAEGKPHDTIDLIDWENPANNEFTVAEEVTVSGKHRKRPDIVLYVNGIAVAVIELKRSTVSVAEGIRQNIDSQKREFIEPFFTTVQLILAGNDTEGIRYGVIGTPEKYYLRWKKTPPLEGSALLGEAGQLVEPERLLDLIRYFIAFDAGIKKIARHNQYYGAKAAIPFVQRRQGGIIWHTQGSGKSLTMVWLAQWIRENVTDGRVLIVTDREELDTQIEDVFKGVDERIERSTSGQKLLADLNSRKHTLMCTLVHKFGAAGDSDIKTFLRDIDRHLPPGFEPKGQTFVFVDEAHRTQSGDLHRAMKAIIPNAALIGFTGTPLLAKDKQSSLETFGPFIHTYKYDEAVRDGVVLDLVYEARDIDQTLKNHQRVDEWFDARTQGLTDVARAQLKRRWGTMQELLSSKARLEMIAEDIRLDMSIRPRLQSGRGNAMLVTDSIRNACRMLEILSTTELAGKVGIVTSYRPSISDVKGEDSGEGDTDNVFRYKVYRELLSKFFDQPEDDAVHRAEEYEDKVKKMFVEQPGQMKLLIVVDKLLTGFDAPPATYLYIDKRMRDHGLFQAVCRVNRLDGEDKIYGHIVDYMDLFGSLQGAIADYTGEAFDAFDPDDVRGLLTNRLEESRKRLDQILEALQALVEPAGTNPTIGDYLAFFTPDTSSPEERTANERKRVQMYTLVSKLIRTYAELSGELDAAGYAAAEQASIEADVKHFEAVRQQIKLASGDYIDLKQYEPAMRNLLDTYVQADTAERIGGFDNVGLVELLVNDGPDAVVKELPTAIALNQDAVAETIVNNVRRVIIDEHVTNPLYFEKMSQLLDTLIDMRRQQKIEYREYLEKLAELAAQATDPGRRGEYPNSVDTAGLQAIYDRVGNDEQTALAVDHTIRATAQDGWRGNLMKERQLMQAIRQIDGMDDETAEDLIDLVRHHDY